MHPCFSTLPGEFIHKKKKCTFFPEIPRLVHPCYLGRMGAPGYSIDCANDLFSYSMNNDEEISFYVSRIFWVLVFSSYSNLATLDQIGDSSKNIGNLSHHTKSLFHQLEQFFIFLRRRAFTISGYVIVICQCLAIAFHSFMGKSKKKINQGNIQSYIY